MWHAQGFLTFRLGVSGEGENWQVAGCLSRSLSLSLLRTQSHFNCICPTALVQSESNQGV